MTASSAPTHLLQTASAAMAAGECCNVLLYEELPSIQALKHHRQTLTIQMPSNSVPTTSMYRMGCSGSLQIICSAAPRIPTDMGSNTRISHLQTVGRRAPLSLGFTGAPQNLSHLGHSRFRLDPSASIHLVSQHHV